jgi:hypothetical protein
LLGLGFALIAGFVAHAVVALVACSTASPILTARAGPILANLIDVAEQTVVAVFSLVIRLLRALLASLVAHSGVALIVFQAAVPGATTHTEPALAGFVHVAIYAIVASLSLEYRLGLAASIDLVAYALGALIVLAAAVPIGAIAYSAGAGVRIGAKTPVAAGGAVLLQGGLALVQGTAGVYRAGIAVVAVIIDFARLAIRVFVIHQLVAVVVGLIGAGSVL